MATRSQESTTSVSTVRRYPIGAECVPKGGVHYRVWAPQAAKVDVCLVDADSELRSSAPLISEENGYFSGHVDAAAGDLYWFRLDDGESLYPDPASRFQPRGPHGPSQVIDPALFEWTDAKWPGIKPDGQVLYEMHIGTFTPEGTLAAATEELAELADVGITVLELMPLADFPGRFGWGYDGVNLFAPTHLYGRPDDFRRFVDRAHSLGMGVILDVVYNHLGPDGNFLPYFSKQYFSKRHHTDWGAGMNFDEEGSGPVREFFRMNAAYWIDEYHVDGLRFDATQDVQDESEEHILVAVAREARRAAGKRSIYLVVENEPQQAKFVRPPEAGGLGMDALWNDDFHHSAMVLLSGRNEAYYSDYVGKPQEFVSAVKRGYLYQGQWYLWQKKPRGTWAFDLPPTAFVHYIQNHDQIANTAQGQRAHTWTSPGRMKAITVLLLLAPQTPMLFQGQEFAASSPFFYFADHRADLAEKVHRGRKEFMAQFPSLARPEVQEQLPDPGHPETFVRSKLDLSERRKHGPMYQLHRDLLRLRREDRVFSAPRCGAVDGAILGEKAFVLRFFGEQEDRLLLINFDPDVRLSPMPEPLLAPPEGARWGVLWSSEDIRYGGSGTPPLDEEGTWLVPGQAALVLGPK